MSEVVTLVNTNRMKPLIAPVALDYVSRALELAGWKPEILDLAFADDYRKEIDSYFASIDPFAVGVTMQNIDDLAYPGATSFLPQIREITSCVKQKTSAPIILGGIGFSIMPHRLLAYCGADYGICGDGEYSFVRLVRCIRDKDEPFFIPGLAFNRNGTVRVNPPFFISMDDFPGQPRDAVDNERYFREGGMGNLEGKRGCTQHCTYCVESLTKGKMLRLRPPENIVDELKTLLRKNVFCVHFCDSEFNFPAEHAVDLCREITGKGLGHKIRWYAYAIPAFFNEELAMLMRRAGCAGITLHIDSADDGILKNLGRHFTVEDIKKTAAACHAAGLNFMCELLLGAPGETQETARGTIELMKSVNPTRIGVAFGIRVYPGTSLARDLEAKGGVHNNPDLKGDSPGFFEPVYFLSSNAGEDLVGHTLKLIAGDERFFLLPKIAGTNSYNCNENGVVVEAVRNGHRGAPWDILRKAILNLGPSFVEPSRDSLVDTQTP